MLFKNKYKRIIITKQHQVKMNSEIMKCDDCSYWFNPEKDNMYILNYKHSHKKLLEERTICSDCFNTLGESYKKDGWKCDDFEDESEEDEDDDKDKAPKKFDLFDFLVAQAQKS